MCSEAGFLLRKGEIQELSCLLHTKPLKHTLYLHFTNEMCKEAIRNTYLFHKQT